MRLAEKTLIAVGSFCACATASLAENLLSFHSDANQVILSLITQMPKQGGYSASNAATDKPPGGGASLFRPAHNNSRDRRSQLLLRRDLPDFRSGSRETQWRITHCRPARGATGSKRSARWRGVWGRWNANGPGTACLFRELDLGPNFTSWNTAKPGDFMKIFWNPNVGRHEHGHSAIFLGVIQENGVEIVHFWSSNIPYGFGEKRFPRPKLHP